MAMSVIWGLPYLLIRIADRQINPGVLVFSRTAPAFLLLLPLVLSRRQLTALRTNLPWIAVFGVVEFGGPWFLMATAERHITSSLTSLLICCVPLMAVAWSRIRRTGESVTPKRYFGLAIGAVGVAALVGLNLGNGDVKWILTMLVICVGYTAGPMILASKLHHVPGPAVVCGATGFVALCWLPWTLLHLPHHVNTETWLSLATLSVVCTVMAFLVFFELIKEVGASRATVVTYVNTAIAVLLGILGLHEPLTVAIAIGFPLVLVGSVFATSKTPEPIGV